MKLVSSCFVLYLCATLLVVGLSQCGAFFVTTTQHTTTQQGGRGLWINHINDHNPATATTTALFDIARWRDLCFSTPDNGDSGSYSSYNNFNSNTNNNHGKGIPIAPAPTKTEKNTNNSNKGTTLLEQQRKAPFERPICVLPFAPNEVLLQGEEKQLHITDPKGYQLLDDALQNHCGIVAMGLMAGQGRTISEIPLCTIENVVRIENEQCGIFCTLRMVGRGKLQQVIHDDNEDDVDEQHPSYTKAICVEIMDDDKNQQLGSNDYNKLSDLIASTIESRIKELNRMEHRLEQASSNSNGKGEKKEEGPDSTKEKQFQLMVKMAKLENRFYEEIDEDADNNGIENYDRDEEEEQQVDNDSSIDKDRWGRFQQAYRVALDTDTQGYYNRRGAVASSSSSTGEGQQQQIRTTREMTALSWAAFGTDLVLTEADSTYRLQALDAKSLLERLSLASQMLQEKLTTTTKTMSKQGISLLEDDDEDE